MDDRITLEPYNDNREHYVLATACFDSGSPRISAHGKTRTEALEELCSALIDLSEAYLALWRDGER